MTNREEWKSGGLKGRFCSRTLTSRLDGAAASHMAGKQIGSIWGHGAYLAPDWSEDILHHMALVATGFHAGRSADEARRSAWTNSDALDVGERLGAAAITKVEAALVVLREAIDNL